MYKDEIIEEVWRNRDAYVKKHNNNLSEIVADLKRRQTGSHNTIIDLRKHDKGVTMSHTPVSGPKSG